MKTKLIVVAGPTASGKTALGIEIAKAINGEIICADSMQVYKGMPIATAAPTPSETAEVPHHLCEFLDVSADFSVAHYCDLAREKIQEISSRGHVPVIVGGTGLFIDSLVNNNRFTQSETDFSLRDDLQKENEETLYKELAEVDPTAAKVIHKNNKKRVVRALELYYSSGKTKTMQDEQSRLGENPYDVLYFVMNFKEREKLYERINIRVDKMLGEGLLDEAKRALSVNAKTASQAIGHKELAPYFSGELPLKDATQNLKRETRRYAKRQITWFKRRNDAVVLYADTMKADELIHTAINKAEEFLHE